MADLNALIAQGAQFRQPDSQLNMMAQLQQLQQGQSTNQLNQMKIAEAQRGMEEANALRRLDPTSASYLQDVMKVSPEKGIALTKARQEAGTAKTEGQIKDVKLLTDKLATIPEMYKRANTPEDFLAIHQSVHSDPVLGPWLNSIGATPDKGLATLQTAAQTPGGLEQYRQQAMSSVGQILESAKPMSVAAGSSVYDPRAKTFMQAPVADTSDVATMKALGYPPTQAGYQAYRDAQRQERMLTPAEEAQRVRIAQASRAVTSKDDKAPSGYRFTKTGELEAIPGGPAAKVKEPTVSEQNASYNINRVLRAATEIKDVTAKDPSALAPGPAEATAQSMGMGGAANVARSSNRQIVYGAQRDALDALLYLATGAAYNKEQLQGAWDSYMPAYTDDAATKLAKQERLSTLLDDAKTRAGKAWTPKMETSMKSLMVPAAGAATPAAGGKLSQAEQTELDALRKRFGK